MISKTIRLGVFALGIVGLAACQSTGVSVGVGSGGFGVGVHGDVANRFTSNEQVIGGGGSQNATDRFSNNEQLVNVDTRVLERVGPRPPAFLR